MRLLITLLCIECILLAVWLLVVFENDSYAGYFTEKITDCFARGTIPIYYGDLEICKHFDCNGIISYSNGVLDTLTTDLYESKKQIIQNNMNIIKEMKMSEDYFTQEFILKWNPKK